jgi:hypothetical protein
MNSTVELGLNAAKYVAKHGRLTLLTSSLTIGSAAGEIATKGTGLWFATTTFGLTTILMAEIESGKAPGFLNYTYPEMVEVRQLEG